MSGVDSTECWEEGNEADAMTPLPKTDTGYIHASKPQPHGDVQIIKYGLVKMWELANKRIELMGRKCLNE